MDRIPKSVQIAPIERQDISENKLNAKQGEFKGRKITLPKSIELLMKGISKLKAFIMKPIHNRQVESYNHDLKKSRTNKDFDRDFAKGGSDMYWYEELDCKMEDKGFDVALIKDKDSDEIHEILLQHKIITPSESKLLKKEKVDLEGSPFW